MAEVWEAVDATLDRDVALKLLHSHLADDAGFVSRFHREARAVARLAHPNVVAVFDTGIDSIPLGRPGAGLPRAFIVMELLRGESVRVLSQRGVPISRAVWIVTEAAKGLGYAHRQGLVHRDVKPANILVTDTGLVKVVDFGIAKVIEGTDRAGEDLTQAGAILGTAKYLSPEQVEGGDINARSDVYALGVVLYELVCGRPPFVGKNDMGTALQHVKDAPPPPRSLRPGVPRSLESFILSALAKDPARRPTDANAFALTLGQLDLAADDAVPSVVRTTDDETPPAGLNGRGRGRQRTADETRMATRYLENGPRTAGAASGRAGKTDATTVRNRPAPPPAAPPKRNLLLRTLVAGIAVVGGVIGGVIVADQQRSIIPTGLTITGVRSFDPPPGNGVENDENLPKIIDGRPETAWESSGYDSRSLGGLDGVGVVFDLDNEHLVRSVQGRSYDKGWSAQVYVSSRSPATLAEWGVPIGAISNAEAGEFSAALTPTSGRYVLVWITDLGPRATPTSRHRAALSEVRVYG